MGQCGNRITVEAGQSQQFPCNEVSITSSGGLAYGSFRNDIGPYWPGTINTGSFTFTFAETITLLR